MSASGQVLRLRGVGARLGEREVLRDVDLDVPAGARLGIVGVNGVGKSTLLRILAGVRRPSTGHAELADEAGDLQPAVRIPARARARLLAYVPQEEVASAELLVGEMVALGRVPRTRPWARGGRREREIVRAALEVVGLGDRIDDPCDRLSGGERRRAVLARGLAQESPTMLLDEPTNHLDVAWQLHLLQTVSDRATTVVATIHDLDLALRSFDRLAVLGRPPGVHPETGPATVVAQGPPEEVLDAVLVEDHFGVGSVQVPHPHLPQSHLLIHPRKDTSA
ncbi:iron complex transport system ATP-binding protein [Nocardioides albertanoniae]|uniref:Iron complex transport system ATP-binding protein n=1 Tax=Nocardioides albertanoniae TaxID=1175486 RepID=A0A543A4V2_9ACTN|nr:ABC transporter ATP-binding protein [Nocardioides albertanoniae]TQL67629.1 iron complex transport system ATP-binding protein [Nocardioides albertanoniae]